MVSRERHSLFVCLNGEIFLGGEVDGIVKGGGSFFAVPKDGESENFTRNLLEHDERALGHFEEGFEFSGLIPRGLGGKSGLGRIPRDEARGKTRGDGFFSGCDLIGFKTDFDGQILGDNIEKNKVAFRGFLSKS